MAHSTELALFLVTIVGMILTRGVAPGLISEDFELPVVGMSLSRRQRLLLSLLLMAEKFGRVGHVVVFYILLL